MSEVWKDIDGYEGLYQISNLGRVKSLKKWDVNLRDYREEERMMSPTDNGHGYLIVCLRKNTHRKNFYVHRLVASAFLENRDGCDVVDHIDHDRKNNKADNLEWCTQKENVIRSSDRMRHRRSITHTNTGERYIYFSRGRYRLVIDRKEYPSSATLDAAIRKRDSILKEVM